MNLCKGGICTLVSGGVVTISDEFYSTRDGGHYFGVVYSNGTKVDIAGRDFYPMVESVEYPESLNMVKVAIEKSIKKVKTTNPNVVALGYHYLIEAWVDGTLATYAPAFASLFEIEYVNQVEVRAADKLLAEAKAHYQGIDDTNSPAIHKYREFERSFYAIETTNKVAVKLGKLMLSALAKEAKEAQKKITAAEKACLQAEKNKQKAISRLPKKSKTLYKAMGRCL